ncbi:MAG: PAS domain S-box protein [Candidatus Thorarchaeota archaeon]
MEYNKEEIRERFHDLFEHSLDLIYVNDLKGNFLDANDITLLTLGYEREEIPKISFMDLVDEDNLKKAFEVTKEIYTKGKQSKRSEYKIKAKDGNYIYVETYGIPLEKEGKIYAILGIGVNITERKKAGQKVKDSGEMFKAIYKEGPIPTYTWKKVDNDFILVDFNNAAEKITNGNVKNYIGIKASELYRDRSDILEELNRCIDENLHITREMRYRFRISDQEKFLSVNYVSVEPDLVIVNTEDITERKIAVENLKESEIKYRNLIENLDVGFYQVTLEGKMLNHNTAHNIILGYDPSEDLRGKNVTDFWQVPEDRNEYLNLIVKEGVARNYICNALTKKGEKIVVELNSHLIRNEEGWPIRIDGTFIDVTEKINLEKRLKESEQKFRGLFENTPFAIVILDSRGIIIDCNPTTENIIGYSREELIGNNFRDLNIIHPKSLPTILTLFKKFVKGERVHRVDVQVYKKNESLIWTNLQASLIKIDDNVYVQAIFTDITQRKEADFLVTEEIRKLKELDTIRKNLISRVSHELKTPLVSVSGGAELLLTLFKDKFNQEMLEIIHLIEKGGKRLRYLVDNLIDITRIEYDRLQLNKKPEDLSEIIRNSAKEMIYLVKSRKIDIILELPETLTIYIDRIRIEQVILNLLSNAIKNSPPESEINIILKKTKKWAEFSVIDNGIGLTKEEMDVLFTRFGKIERYGEGYEFLDIQGSGLGLYITKEIIDLHKGEIRAESEGRYKGSKFVVKLPIE